MESSAPVRLDRFLANAHVGTRSEVRRLIKSGAVTVSGVVVTDPSFKVYPRDEVEVEGKLVAPHRKVYIALNKPAGYVSTTSDREPSVLALINHPYISELHIAGRLDKDVEGLLILTNDGEFTHRLISPKSHVEKEYLIELDGEATVDERLKRRFESGIVLEDGTKTLPARIEAVGRDVVSITLVEGKYHQIKRMCKAVGLRWKRIVRVRIGCLLLEGLGPGEWRELTTEEASQLTKNCGEMRK